MNRRRSSWSAAFGHALRGIREAVRSERNMRFHLTAAAAAAVLGIWQRVGPADWLWLGAAAAIVLTAEMINTAVERVVDLASPQDHPLAKAAKDAAAGAVLIAAVFAAAVGLIVLGPPIWRTIFG
ncbi:diacylglycerol kinase family protein [Cohnella caldifontis]|uniref:diacylglycerol kinase family protein n=1 Tax=Cohnella caldifontis TaxID=3027471 RepID=UPI0023EDA6C0|nr:diacylglycerol kinase family protein [Cohnella sp. YIM B05605]